MSSERRLASTDIHLVNRVLRDMVAKLKRAGTKAIYQHLNVHEALGHIFEFTHAYIVADAYLVIYEIGTPWYVNPGTLVLNEVLVLRLAVSGDFAAVPAFLERKAREANAQLILAGTALAKSDAALASLYKRSGFTAATITLTKEP